MQTDLKQKITLNLEQWREATDKAIKALQDSVAMADVKAGKTPHPEDRMLVTVLGINVCAELEKVLFPQ
jgi:hypothetical protein